MFSNWIICVILYLFLATVFTQAYKVCTKTLKNPGALTILLELIAGITVLIMAPFFDMKFPTDMKVYIFLGIAIIFYTIADRLNTTVRSGIEASTFSLLQQLSTVFLTFSGFVFFKEEFIFTKFLGAILILFSNIFIFFQKGKTKLDKHVALGILSNLSFTIALFLDVNISDNFNLPFYVSTTLTVPAILIFFVEKIKLSDLKEEIKYGNKPAILLTAVCWSTSILFSLRAYQLGNVSVVAPLCALTVILNVIVGYIFLKERDNMPKKIIAALLVILSIFLIKG